MINRVRGLIEADGILANCDLDLCWRVWGLELKNQKPSVNIEKITARELMTMLKKKTLPGIQNITRSRRKCQEKFPHTRGEVWGKRHELQDQVKKDLGYK